VTASVTHDRALRYAEGSARGLLHHHQGRYHVEATRSIRQAEVGSTKTMLDRVKTRFDLHPERLIADTAYGTGPMLGWLVDRKIAPHIPVFDKSGRSDGTWTRADFEWDAENNRYICPESA